MWIIIEMLKSQTRIIVTSVDRIITSTSSKGNQIKWNVRGQWIKADSFGYEGLVEIVASRILEESNIDYFVKYDCVEILEEDTGKVYRGCISDDFLNVEESLITLHRLFEANGINIDLVLRNKSVLEQLRYVSEVVTNITGIQNFKEWICLLLEFDEFILNEDRHLQNIAVIYNKKTNSYRLMPIFDCGAGLLSDTTIEYKMNRPIISAIRSVSAKPFSTNFSKQLKAVKEYNNGLKLNIAEPRRYYSKIYSQDEVDRANKILRIRYETWKNKFN